MSEITTLLQAAGGGDSAASDQLFTMLYADLRRLARSRLRKSGEITLLETTALVHESFMRFRGAGALDFPDRQHFLAYASRVMRTVVVDMVRARQAERRGGHAVHQTLQTSAASPVAAAHDEQILQVHEALEAFAKVDPRAASMVELRYFGGLTEPEIAAVLGVTERTVQRDWQKARLYLSTLLE
jgi:RNA polymerase sigma factor (TIGR02999 family)